MDLVLLGSSCQAMRLLWGESSMFKWKMFNIVLEESTKSRFAVCWIFLYPRGIQLNLNLAINTMSISVKLGSMTNWFEEMRAQNDTPSIWFGVMTSVIDRSKIVSDEIQCSYTFPFENDKESKDSILSSENKKIGACLQFSQNSATGYPHYILSLLLLYV